MAEAFIKPKFTQAEIEEFGELLDIARFLIDEVSHAAVDDPGYWEKIAIFKARREAFIELIYGRLNPTGAEQ